MLKVFSPSDAHYNQINCNLFQGEVKFLIGGDVIISKDIIKQVRERLCRMIRCESETDGYSPDGRNTAFAMRFCMADLTAINSNARELHGHFFILTDCFLLINIFLFRR